MMFANTLHLIILSWLINTVLLSVVLIHSYITARNTELQFYCLLLILIFIHSYTTTSISYKQTIVS